MKKRDLQKRVERLERRVKRVEGDQHQHPLSVTLRCGCCHGRCYYRCPRDPYQPPICPSSFITWKPDWSYEPNTTWGDTSWQNGGTWTFNLSASCFNSDGGDED